MAKPHYRRSTNGQTRLIGDGLRNMASGMGTSRDKAGQADYYRTERSADQLVTAYDASALVQKAIDMPAEDSVREWREWQADAKQITSLEAEEARLSLPAKVLRARRVARLLGGSAILIGDGAKGDRILETPLEPASIRKGGIKYLTVLTKSEMTPDQQELDVLSEFYGTPQFWQIQGTTQTLSIHPSRLAIFHGVEPVAQSASETFGWGKSSLEGMFDPIKRVEEAAANVLSLIYEAKVDVFGIPDLMQQMQDNGEAFTNAILERLSLAAQGKGLSGTLVMDALETYDQKSASFGGLPDVLDRLMQLASAATGIPMTLLFGMSPGGLNATGESDARAYYDRIKVEQTLKISPAMSILNECLIYSAFGARPSDIHYNWRPLWQPTAKERAETAKTQAETMKTVKEMNVVSDEALGTSTVNALTESGAFPGLEGAVDEFGGVDPLDPVERGETQEVDE